MPPTRNARSHIAELKPNVYSRPQSTPKSKSELKYPSTLQGNTQLKSQVTTVNNITYHYIHREMFQKAKKFELPPEALGLLLDSHSPYPAPDHSRDELRKINAVRTMDDMFVLFVQTIPGPDAFTLAWERYIDIMIDELPLEEVPSWVKALHEYSRLIHQRAREYTWESVCKYHLVMSLERLRKMAIDAWTGHKDLEGLPYLEPRIPSGEAETDLFNAWYEANEASKVRREKVHPLWSQYHGCKSNGKVKNLCEAPEAMMIWRQVKEEVAKR